MAQQCSDEERFRSAIERVGECDLWRGAVDGQSGRGRFWCEGKAWDAPRLAWAAANGPVPQDCRVAQRCRSPRCVRPEHLVLAALTPAAKAALYTVPGCELAAIAVHCESRRVDAM